MIVITSTSQAGGDSFVIPRGDNKICYDVSLDRFSQKIKIISLEMPLCIQEKQFFPKSNKCIF